MNDMLSWYVCYSGNGADITIGTEMIGQSIQCSANNGLFSDSEMPISQAVQIDPYSKFYAVLQVRWDWKFWKFSKFSSSCLIIFTCGLI